MGNTVQIFQRRRAERSVAEAVRQPGDSCGKPPGTVTAVRFTEQGEMQATAMDAGNRERHLARLQRVLCTALPTGRPSGAEWERLRSNGEIVRDINRALVYETPEFSNILRGHSD